MNADHQSCVLDVIAEVMTTAVQSFLRADLGCALLSARGRARRPHLGAMGAMTTPHAHKPEISLRRHTWHAYDRPPYSRRSAVSSCAARRPRACPSVIAVPVAAPSCRELARETKSFLALTWPMPTSRARTFSDGRSSVCQHAGRTVRPAVETRWPTHMYPPSQQAPALRHPVWAVPVFFYVFRRKN